VEVYNLSYKLAFDKNLGLEFFVFKHMYYDKKKKIFFSKLDSNRMINPIGTLLLIFLNTDFENDEECSSFIFWFCFESLYYSKYPKLKEKNRKSVSQLKFSDFDFYKELISLTEKNKEDFLFLKYTLLKNLRLPYDPNFFRKFDIEAGFSKKELEEIAQSEKGYYENKSIRYDDIKINGFIENLKIKYETMDLLFENIDIFKYNIPYFFTSDNLNSILTLDFKEFMSDNSNIIRQCQNCGKYFVPSNLKETKYCHMQFENTGKTCKQIGKELAYKKSLKEDKVLDMYRRRYMSLASAVSHYGTDKAIERFEKYKTEGAIMKAKYQNKEISAEEFENWINSTKKKK